MKDLEDTIRFYMTQGLTIDEAILEIERVLGELPVEIKERARYNVLNTLQKMAQHKAFKI